MEIVNMKIGEVHPYENNPRVNDDAVDQVAESIKTYGFKNPIIVDKDNVIICGHTRLRAAKKLGLKSVPVIVAADLSPEKVKAYRLADNKTSDFAIWDNKKLLKELEEINKELFTGFETSDFFEDVGSLSEVEELDEADKRVLDENSEGAEYKLVFKTKNVKMIEAVRDFIEQHGGLEDE